MFGSLQDNRRISEGRKIWVDISNRRAAVSVVSNIAEGYGQKTTTEYIRFLYIAYGSNCELETQILLSGDLGYIDSSRLEELKEGIREVERMLKALINSLESNP